MPQRREDVLGQPVDRAKIQAISRIYACTMTKMTVGALLLSLAVRLDDSVLLLRRVPGPIDSTGRGRVAWGAMIGGPYRAKLRGIASRRSPWNLVKGPNAADRWDRLGTLRDGPAIVSARPESQHTHWACKDHDHLCQTSPFLRELADCRFSLARKMIAGGGGQSIHGRLRLYPFVSRLPA